MHREQKLQAMVALRKVADLLRRWDPIGVLPGREGSANEYDAYAPQIVSLVTKGCDLNEVAAHLSHVRTQIIGVDENVAADQEMAGEILSALRPDPTSMPHLPGEESEH
jgi:hypothetical protein